MNIVRETILRFLCPHEEKEFVRNDFGGGVGADKSKSVWRCKGCGCTITENSRHYRESSNTLDDAYFDRNQAAQGFAWLAGEAGYNYGVDRKDAEWPILRVDLPSGQVSWHIPAAELIGDWPAYEGDWDGHTLEEKRKRINHWLNSSDMGTKMYITAKELAEIEKNIPY